MSTANKILNKSLKSILVDLIRFRGSMSVAEYMKIVLTNPSSGFYTKEDVFGVKGHFITNPEISQIFGEILGAWIIQEWNRFGCRKPLRLVEFGPGRGTLMTDITRTIGRINGNVESLQLRMIEMSTKLKDIQKETLTRHSESLVEQARWHAHLDALKEEETQDGFTAYIAHEFLDALPIHKFIRDPSSNRWREVMIDYDQNEELRFCIGKQPTLAAKLLIPKDFEGDHIEVCPEAALCLEKVSKRLSNSNNGCMLICDYGFEEKLSSIGTNQNKTTSQDSPPRVDRDTFRAFKDHQSWPALRDPGQADLTADVDFHYLRRQIENKALVFGPVSQNNFLSKCGLHSRLESLLVRANPEEREELISGAKMMTEDMGERYKFMAIFPKGTERLFEDDPPAGFHATR